MSKQNPEQDRSIPDSWHTPLRDIPAQFRASALAYAWKLYDAARERKYAASFRSEIDIVSEMTGLSPLSYAVFTPFHQISQADVATAMEVLGERGPGELLKWVDDRHPVAGTVLVIGDNPSETHFATCMNDYIDRTVPRYLLAGPGVTIDSLLKGYSTSRGVSKFFIRTVDNSGGKSWDTSPGPALDKRISEVFDQHRPTSVLALEPVRLPACQFIIEQARARKINIEYVDAPLAKKRT
jgi:hypothetical protein